VIGVPAGSGPLSGWMVVLRPSGSHAMNPEIVLSKVNDQAVVALTGDFDGTSAHRLRAALNEAVRTAGSEVLVDMSGITFIDATVLGVLVDAFVRAGELPRGLSLVRTPPHIAFLLRLLALDRLLSPEPSSGRSCSADPGSVH